MVKRRHHWLLVMDKHYKLATIDQGSFHIVSCRLRYHIPDPVPPKECAIWKPWGLSHASALTLTASSTSPTNSIPSLSLPFPQLFPVPYSPKMKLSFLNNFPIGDDFIASKVPGSKSTKTTRGTKRNDPVSVK